MPTTTISNCAFDQNPDAARRAAEYGPLIITDQGRPMYVLLRFEDYQKLAGAQRSLLNAVA